MTRDQLKNCYQLRKELELTQRRLAASSNDTEDVFSLKAKSSELIAGVRAVEEYINMLDCSLTRQILTLRFVEGVSIRETASFTGYSVSNMNILLRKALNDLNEK